MKTALALLLSLSVFLNSSIALLLLPFSLGPPSSFLLCVSPSTPFSSSLPSCRCCCSLSFFSLAAWSPSHTIRENVVTAGTVLLPSCIFSCMSMPPISELMAALVSLPSLALLRLRPYRRSSDDPSPLPRAEPLAMRSLTARKIAPSEHSSTKGLSISRATGIIIIPLDLLLGPSPPWLLLPLAASPSSPCCLFGGGDAPFFA
mmetsp:Transcript_26314/g.36727  ORF Transcript_26314/g.36727 Transcript_26314/m.36727 type:complete len:203 (-) Transcript_26314:200-808(-)